MALRSHTPTVTEPAAIRLRALIILMATAASAARPAQGQSPGARWSAELGGGYATSLDDPAMAPGGGPYVSGFVGYGVSPLVTLGASVGWHQYVNGASEPSYEAACPPPEPPGPGCVRTRDAEEAALDVSAAIRIEPATGTWRPYALATVGVYRFSEDVTYLTFDRNGEELLDALPATTPAYTGAGGSLGMGVAYTHPGSRWSLAAGARVHGVLGDPYGEWGSNSWVEFGLAVRRRF